MPKKIIEGSRGKTLGYLIGSLAFSAVAWVLVHDDPAENAWKLWLGLAFSSLCALGFLGLVIRPQRLVMDDTGFSLQGGLVVSPKKVAWRDIDAFFVCTLSGRVKAVGYKYRPDATNLPMIVKVNRAFGVDGTLPLALPTALEELAAELNAYRERAVATSASVGMLG